MTMESMILTLGYFAISGLMVVNGITGFPSSSLLYITAGFLVASQTLSLPLVIVTGAVGNVVGNIILYELSRKKGTAYVVRWRVFSGKSIIRLQKAFERRGIVIIFIGKLLSGIRVVVPIVAGLAEMNRAIYVATITVTSFLWATALTCFGLYFGNTYHHGTSSAWIAIPLMVIAIVLFYRYVLSISVE